MAKEEVFWRQKSREKWLDEEDRNMKFFHNSTLHNRAKRKILKVKDPLGNTIENLDKIAEIFVSHFQNILNNYDNSNRVAQEKMLKAIPRVVTLEDNKTLNKPISLEEVRLVLFNMNPDKSLGPDRFQTFFYQKC